MRAKKPRAEAAGYEPVGIVERVGEASLVIAWDKGIRRDGQHVLKIARWGCSLDGTLVPLVCDSGVTIYRSELRKMRAAITRAIREAEDQDEKRHQALVPDAAIEVF